MISMLQDGEGALVGSTAKALCCPTQLIALLMHVRRKVFVRFESV